MNHLLTAAAAALVGCLSWSAAASTETPTLPPVETVAALDAFGATAADESIRWHVSPEDITIRQALTLWADLAGWTFEPEMWSLPVDITVAANAHFFGEFPDAVRDLVAAVALAEMPIRSCFYTNKVLRIVSYNQVCNRTHRSQ